MNRYTFLKSILAAICAPFVVKKAAEPKSSYHLNDILSQEPHPGFIKAAPYHNEHIHSRVLKMAVRDEKAREYCTHISEDNGESWKKFGTVKFNQMN